MKKLLLFAILLVLVGCSKDGLFSQLDDVIGIFETGVLDGKFSVGSDKQVCFSKGNLQYQASKGVWRFADHQWDYIGYGNENISNSYSGWIDLFGWGTGNNPTNISGNNGDYGFYSEWGNNKISNGGNKTYQWRTLSIGEWDYLLRDRSTPSSIRYACACVNGTNGMVVLPDDWDASYYTLYNVNDYGRFSVNTISSDDWEKRLEAHGAVFLPAAGARGDDGMTSLKHVGEGGYYWSSTAGGVYTARRVFFSDDRLHFNDRRRYFGGSVRLVQ